MRASIRKRSERGVGIFEVVALIATLTVVATGVYFKNLKNKNKNPLAGGAEATTKLNVCLASLPKAKALLIDTYPPGETIPLDDEHYKVVADCQRDITKILEDSADAAQDPKWAELLQQAKEPIDNLGSCGFQAPSPKSKPAGQPGVVAVGLAATIPLSDPAVVGTVQASTGETAKLTRTGKLKFDGTIYLDGSNQAANTQVTLSLTASGAVPVACPQTVFTWTDPFPYSVSLLPPAGGTTVTTDSVTVIGQVTPAPASGTTVELKVNGKPRSSASTDGAGNFTSTVALDNKASISKVEIINPGKPIAACGNAISSILVKNNHTPLDLANKITATVIGEGGAKASRAAELSVTHAVKVAEVQIVWTGTCPGPFESHPRGDVIPASEARDVGVVTCGFDCPPPAEGINCEATAQVTVKTQVGSTFHDALWTIRIPPP